MLKINEKSICYFLVAILFFMGMCLDTTKIDSSFDYINLKHASAVISSVDYLSDSTDSCTSEMIGKNNTLSSIRGEMGKNVIRWDRTILLFMIVGVCLQSLLYFRSTVAGEYYEILRSGTVAVNYIHHKDGEK